MTSNQFKNIKIEIVEPGICVFRVARPQALNALNMETLQEMKSALKQIANNPAVRVLILTGDGDKAFIAGADIAEMKEAILKDKDSKYTPEEKARALKVLELAESGNVEARDAVRSARNEAAKRGGIDGTTATLVGVGIVVGVLAGWYAYKKLSEAREPYVAKVPVR